MKIKLFFQLSWIYIFLNVQESPQQLPNSWLMHMERKNQVLKEIWFYLLENICTFNFQSFFLVFSLPISSINGQHCIQTLDTNPNLKTNPNSCKIFLNSWKFEFQTPAVFSPQKPLHWLQEVSLSKYTLMPWVKASWIAPYTCIHNWFFLEFVFLLSACFNWF